MIPCFSYVFCFYWQTPRDRNSIVRFKRKRRAPVGVENWVVGGREEKNIAVSSHVLLFISRRDNEKVPAGNNRSYIYILKWCKFFRDQITFGVSQYGFSEAAQMQKNRETALKKTPFLKLPSHQQHILLAAQSVYIRTWDWLTAGFTPPQLLPESTPYKLRALIWSQQRMLMMVHFQCLLCQTEEEKNHAWPVTEFIDGKLFVIAGHWLCWKRSLRRAFQIDWLVHYAIYTSTRGLGGFFPRVLFVRV